MSADQMKRIKYLVHAYIECPDPGGDKGAEGELQAMMQQGYMQATLDSLKTFLRDTARPRNQLMGFQLLDSLHLRGNMPFHLQLSSERWMNRIIQYGKGAKLADVGLRVAQMIVDWEFRSRGSMFLSGYGTFGVQQLALNGLPVPPPTPLPPDPRMEGSLSSSFSNAPLGGSFRGGLPRPPTSPGLAEPMGGSLNSSFGRPPPLAQSGMKMAVGTPAGVPTKGMVKGVKPGMKSPAPPKALEGHKLMPGDAVPGLQTGRRLSTVTDIEAFMADVNADLALVQLSIMRPDVASSGQVKELEQRQEQLARIAVGDLPPETAQALRDLDAEIKDTLELRSTVAAAPPAQVGVKLTSPSPSLIRDRDLRRAPPPLPGFGGVDSGSEVDRLRAALRESQAHAQRLQSDLESALKERDQLAAAAPPEPSAPLPPAMPPGLVAAIRAHAAQTRRAAEFCRTQALEAAVQLEQCSNFLTTRHAEAMEALGTIARTPSHEKLIKTLQENYLREMKLRKKYYNDLQEMRGNIRVYCRVRPMIEKEISEGHRMVIEHPDLETKDELVVRDDQGERPKPRRYEFDRVFQASEDQADVFRDTKPLIESVVDGYNVCIFAYGQTGSGKTYTMEGPSRDPGVNFRALQRLFEVIDERSEVDSSEVNLSVLEIYNENIRDLLVDTKVARERKYEVKIGGETGNYITNLESYTVKSVEEIRKLCETAHRHRSSGRTNMNEHSSRSHMILYFVVRTVNKATGNKCFGKLSLIDLAGSERIKKSQAEGQRAEEAKCINLSLSALGKTISALGQKQSHVPYRESKLTHLLQDSLGGQSKVLMFANISPASYNTSETCSTLEFATRARDTALGKAERNVEKGQKK
eukprot:Hpha_TRINITY_DN12712_c0_g2::TRINITY_DN12712_c0_g2_i1::g.114287::m.114287/K10406/KIFC2_3; kinesin family member C2/C3